jgi:hypothetical protein
LIYLVGSDLGNLVYFANLDDNNWTSQFVAASDSAKLFLGSDDTPQVVCVANQSILIFVWDGKQMTINQSLPLPEDCAGWLGANYNSTSGLQLLYTGQHEKIVKFAQWTGYGWSIQKIKENLFPSGHVAVKSVVFDSKGYSHIIFANSEGNIKYVSWTGEKWNIQFITNNVTNYYYVSNIVLNTMDDPSFCFIQSYGTYNPKSGNYMYKDALRYAFLSTSNDWQFSTIESDYNSKSFLRLDAEGKPQVYYYKNQELILDTLNGSNWSNQTIQTPTTFTNINSLVVDSKGQPCIAYDVVVGTHGGSSFNGDLTYASVENPQNPPFDYTLAVVIFAALIISAVTILVVSRHRRRKTVIAKLASQNSSAIDAKK